MSIPAHLRAVVAVATASHRKVLARDVLLIHVLLWSGIELKSLHHGWHAAAENRREKGIDFCVLPFQAAAFALCNSNSFPTNTPQQLVMILRPSAVIAHSARHIRSLKHR